MQKEILKVDGKLLGSNATEQVTERFQKRKFWLETDTHTDWPQVIEFELVQDKVNVIDKFKNGDMLSVGFNLRGRRYTSKKTGQEGVINSLNAWFVDKSKQNTEAPVQAESTTTENDLPF